MERTEPQDAMTIFRGSVPGASAAFLDKKAKSEIEDQLQQLQAECAAKDEEIGHLKEQTSQGKMQKRLQKALEENRDLRQEVERLYDEQISVKEISACLEAQEALTESVQKEFVEYREQTKIGIEQMRQDREEADKQLIVFQQHAESVKQIEKETINLNDDLQKQVTNYEAQLHAQATLIAKLKDGTRLEELESATVTLSDHLAQKEAERQDLERALLQSKSENAQFLQCSEDFEEKIKSTLSETVTNLTEQLQHYKILVETRDNELLSEHTRYALLEDCVIAADRKALDMGEKIRLYETGYCLDDALKEQRSLNEELSQLKKEITSMTGKLNTRERQLERLVEENRVLRIKAGIDINWGISEAELELERNVEIEKLSSLNDHYKNRIDKLEQDRIELLEDLRRKAIQKGESGVVFFGLSAQKMELVEKYVDALRNGEEFSPSNEGSAKLKLELDRAFQALSEMRMKYDQATLQCNELRRAMSNTNMESNDKKIDQIMELISRLQSEKQSENVPRDEGNVEIKSLSYVIGDHQVSASHLVACLQELAKTEELLQMSTSTIASYEFSIMNLSERVNSLFLLHSEASENFKTEKDQLEQVIEKLSNQLSSLIISTGRDSTTVDAPASEEAAVEASRRRIAVLQSNEILLTRRLNILEQTLLTLESREARSRDERVKLERVLKARVVQLEHSLSNSTARVQSLETHLRDSVRKDLYENIQSEIKTVQSKFSELVADHAQLQQQCHNISAMQTAADLHATEALNANAKVESLSKQIEVLQAKLDEMPCEDDNKVQLLAQVAALEIREGNAQRALTRTQMQITENASRYATLSADLSALEDKHQSLLLSYHTETDTTVQLRKALSTQTADHAAAVADLQSQLIKAKNNAIRFKKLFQIAKKQAVQLSDCKQEVEEQITGLKQAIIELQSSSDEHVALGQVHHELIDARLQIRNLKRNLEENAEQLQGLEIEVLRQSKLLDENAAASFSENSALRNRIDFLHQCLADVTTANGWGLSGDQALALHATNKSLAKRLNDARTEIIKADDGRRQAEEALGRLRITRAQTEESQHFVKTLQFGDIDEKFQLQILEWTKQLKQLKLTKLQLEHQIAFLANRNAFDEKLLTECQDELQRMQTVLSEKDSKLVAQTVHFKQQASALAEFSQRKPQEKDAYISERSESSSELEGRYEKEIAQIRQEIKSLHSILGSKEEIIELQRQQLNKLESKIKAEVEASITATAEDPEMSKEKILKAAEITIQSLRVLLSQKDAALNKYRDILELAFQKYHSEKELDMLVIEQLKEQIASEKAEQSSMLRNALNKIEDAKQVPMSLISIAQHEEALAQKQKTIEELSTELKTVQGILEQTRKRSTELESEQQLLKDRVQKHEAELGSWQESELMLSDLRQELLEKSRKQNHLEDVIMQLKEQMVVFRQQQPPQQPIASSENAELKKTISNLRVTMKKFESQKAELEQKFRTLEQEHSLALNDLQRVRKALESSHDEIASLHNQLNAVRSKLKVHRDKHTVLSERMKSLTLDLEQLEEAKSKVDKLQRTVSDQEQMIDTLQNKDNSHHLRNVSEAVKTSRACSPVNFPENETVSPRGSQKDAFEQWEMKKKLEKKVEALKAKLKEKSTEIKQLETCISDLKMKIQQLENDNRQLIEALRSSEQNGKQGKGSSAAVSDDQLESLEELRAQLFQSQDEIVSLKRKLEVEAAGRIAQLEFELKNIQAVVKDKPRSAPEKSKLKQELDALSQKNLATSCENLDLRFDKEHSNIIILRLRKRIANLEQLMARGIRPSPNAKESKSESELTATIDSMAKIINSLKQENETLRLNSHSHLKYTEAVRSLKKAKKDWNSEVETLKAQLHAKAEEISSLAHAESAAKLNCRALRRDLAKVKKELNAKESEANLLAQSILELEAQIEELRQTIEDLQTAGQQQEAIITASPENSERWNELRSKYADLLTENEALKTELSAFDESFFDEIEDLKFQYAETSKRLARYRTEFGELPVH